MVTLFGQGFDSPRLHLTFKSHFLWDFLCLDIEQNVTMIVIQ